MYNPVWLAKRKKKGLILDDTGLAWRVDVLKREGWAHVQGPNPSDDLASAQLPTAAQARTKLLSRLPGEVLPWTFLPGLQPCRLHLTTSSYSLTLWVLCTPCSLRLWGSFLSLLVNSTHPSYHCPQPLPQTIASWPSWFHRISAAPSSITVGSSSLLQLYLCLWGYLINAHLSLDDTCPAWTNTVSLFMHCGVPRA